ncbi:unnamed protein product [Psylliodes chrysocephalus]|uniref:SET domain-containing protein n=1 Tax=Psylliodes chrysocephalus TaxID=3402493 RepID=A0A9P0CJF5_9CUCU|nr:unnamed protein product [Psylliodes chrysocephala]
MSVCFESSNVLTNVVSTSPETSLEDNVANQPITSVASQSAVTTNIVQPLASNNIHNTEKPEQIISSTKSIAKLVVANASASTSSVLQKVVNPPLITVLNPSGPLTVVKTLCVTSGVSSAPQFTLVNSAPLNVTNAVGKSPTITLLNAPVTVVKAITTPQNVIVEKNLPDMMVNAAVPSNTSPVSTIIENRAHNVFVKNTCPDSTIVDVPQSHKLLTANNFPQTNILANPQSKTLNGQRNKLKIVSNVVVPGTSQTNNILVNKSNQRYIPRPKVLGPNSATTKYINKNNPSNFVKPGMNPQMKMIPDKSPTRMVYPTHKGQIKTLQPVNNFVQKQHQHGIKTITPQNKAVPGHVTRTGSGLRTIPPQKAHKMPNKPNYIGKHAVQAQKMRQAHGKVKGLKIPYNVHVPPMPDKHLNELTFNQALTAQIIETLSNSSTPTLNNRYDVMPSRYDNAFTCPEIKPSSEPCKPVEDTNKSGLDALSLICQAVLLDHNYNATLPPDSPTRPSPPLNVPTQVNGLSTPIYSPGSSKRRPMPSSSTITSPPIISNMSLGITSNALMTVRDDDAASDISDGSDRKHDTEGEETDTAPEAEAVSNENFDGYGDYVTRCICGYLHDDGYMVECDKCKVWQHVQCVVKNKQVPDEYLCEECDTTKHIDRQKARAMQQQWLRERQLIDPKLRKDPKVKEMFKPKEVISDSDSSDGEHVPNNFVPKPRVLANKRKSENHPKPSLARQRRENVKEVVQKRQKRKERKIIRKKTRVPIKNQSDDENQQDTWASHLPQLRQWIEKYEEAVTNHYSPELRARISSIRVNGAHSDSNIQFDATVHKCRVHTQPVTEIKYLVATVNLPANTPVVELRGKYMLSTQHRNSGGSLTTRQHSQRPGPFLFFYRLQKDNTEVCVDTRTYGNSARFIRRSCKPNAELRHCIEKGVLHIYVVSTASVDKNCELTIKHESHDLAAIGTTSIACACGNHNECTVNKSSIKKNGETLEVPGRKRRRRRIVTSAPPEPDPPKPVKEPPPLPLISPPLPPPSPVKLEVEKLEIKKEEEEKVAEEIKETIPEPPPLEIKKEEPKLEEVKVEIEVEEPVLVKTEVEEDSSSEENKDAKSEKSQPDEVMKSPPPTPVSTRRASHKSDKEEDKSSPVKKEDKKEKSKKLSREERKLEAILRAIEQMEKAESRKQEHQAKQAHRRESEPNPAQKEEEKQEPKLKRRRRKGRARTVSQSAARRNRLNSTDSYMTTSGEENLLSPNDNQLPTKPSSKDTDPNDNRAVGLLLALSNGENDGKEQKSPARDIDSNSNSAHSSPETPLSSACLLVQAAVEPLEQGFKFPKTKKGLMNEWLNKVPEPVQTASAISPTSIGSHGSNSVDMDTSGMFASKNLAQVMSYCDANIQPRGSAKKRWLRQAISEDHSCDSPSSRPDSPPISDMVAPPKKRRLPRESISNDNSPPSTPTGPVPVLINNMDQGSKNLEGSVEIVYTGTEGDSPNQTLESDAVLKERAAKMKQEFSKPLFSSTVEQHSRADLGSSLSCLDPRLSRENRFLANTDLVGTVEKTLSILGLENTETRKPEPTTPKRKVKLSITEYRQRKKLNVEEKSEEHETEPVSTEENNSSESFKMATRHRSASASSSTSLTSSDDDVCTPEIVVKAPVFNSEPTELERQRETSSLRLKKAFGLSIDKEPPAALNIKAILNLELESPKLKPVPLLSPTFPIPGNVDLATKESTEVAPAPNAASPEPPILAESPPPIDKPPAMETSTEEMETEDISVTDDPDPVVEEKDATDADEPQNMFYTPDEEDAVVPPAEKEETSVSFEEAESISYVPPFNNPVYPNSSFTNFSSTIGTNKTISVS